MLRKLDIALDMQRQIFSALWQSAELQEERARIKQFFEWYAKKYNLKNE
jgi:hypothetical protein